MLGHAGACCLYLPFEWVPHKGNFEQAHTLSENIGVESILLLYSLLYAYFYSNTNT